jgi:hypothetical protein
MTPPPSPRATSSKLIRSTVASWWMGVAALTLIAGCTRSTEPEQPTTTPSEAPANVDVTIDAQQLLDTVATLASDGLGGRYSLHRQDIGRAADYIASRFEAAGVEPVGERYRHDFEMVTGAELTSPPELAVVRRGKRSELTVDDFAPTAMGGSATLEAPVVFVGYGAQSTKDSPIAYDDLEGVDVEGKIALVLAETPNRPSPRRLYRALRQVRRKFDAKAARLRDTGDAHALGKLYVDRAKRMAAIVRPFVGKHGVPKALTALPDDPLTAELDITPFANLVFSPEGEPSPRFGFRAGRLRGKVKRLQDMGASAVLVVKGPHSFVDPDRREADPLPQIDNARESSRFDIPVVRMRWAKADEVFRIGGKTLSATQHKIDQTYRPLSGELTKTTIRLSVQIEPIVVPVPNVLATIPGTKHPEEIVVLGAHYDHIGTDEEGHGYCGATGEGETKDLICNGADDNASGTAVVLETARVMAESGFRPERTVVFALFAAEELGLHGSRALADNPPAVPPFENGKVVAMLNVDMVGRLSEQGLFIGGVGSSSGWMPLLDELGTRGIPTLYDASTTSRSDQASFYKHQVPVLFFFTGVHDDYHAPGDETEGINTEGLTAIAGLVHDLTEEIAAGYDVPFVEPDSPHNGLVGALPGDNPQRVIKRVPEVPTADE